MHTRDPRLGLILAAIALGVVVMLGVVGFLLAGVDEEDPNSSFASTVLRDTGWTRYESATEGFSIELPPSWSRYTKAIPSFGDDLKFAAWGFSPFEEATWLYVFEWPDRSGLRAEIYFEQQRLQIASDPAVVGVTDLRDIEVPEGVLYSFASVIRSPAGRRTETVYGLLHGGHEYRLVFIVPLEQKNEYDSLFDDIAKSFEIVESGQ